MGELKIPKNRCHNCLVASGYKNVPTEECECSCHKTKMTTSSKTKGSPDGYVNIKNLFGDTEVDLKEVIKKLAEE